MTMRAEDRELLTAMREAACAAGALAHEFFRPGAATRARVDWKEGGSPVTEADYVVDSFLRESLRALLPEAGWLSEETADDPARLARPRTFIVDPIDGTRAFVKGDQRWAVSVALVENGAPALAVLHLPATGETFVAAAGGGAFLNDAPIRVSARAALAGGAMAGPPKWLDRLAQTGFPFERRPAVPSLAYRLAQVACGRLDAGIASTNAWDWDIAAADLIVREAGGVLTDLEKKKPAYNSPLPRHGALGAAPVALHDALIAALNEAASAEAAGGAADRDRNQP
jgi:myo-inositol-1(or 4)-monophosphatase